MRVRERYGSDAQELRTYVTELVASSGKYLTLDPSEVSKIGPGIPPGVQTAVSRLSVIIPKAPEQAEFTSRLKTALQGARDGEVEMVDSDTNPNEITLIALTNLFPLRYSKQLVFLKQKYDQKINGANAARSKLELHIEGDGSQHPRLFVPAQEEVRRDAVPYLLLAKAIGLLRMEAASTGGGVGKLTFVAKDGDGFDTDPILLGKDYADALGKVTLESLDSIREFVVQRLASVDYVAVPAREDLQKAVVAEVDAIKLERGNNVNDDTYRRFLDGGKQAVRIIKES